MCCNKPGLGVAFCGADAAIGSGCGAGRVNSGCPELNQREHFGGLPPPPRVQLE
jgi:hypothetical protein